MKKSYEKPYACMEVFEVSDFIAGNCTIDVGFGDTGATKLCSIPDPDFGDMGEMLFNNYDVCTLIWDENYDTGCYDIPVGGQGYFGS